MLIALDHNGDRIQAFKGGLGRCQICGNDVRAYCGEINVHHWRHIDLSKCDFWKENETEWHREWKRFFPVDWQEVVVRKDGLIHRADVKTDKGLVIEFQNSSISSGEIKQREHFYENMIWLVNAKEFKGNFRLWSLVKAQLRYLEESYSSILSSIEYEMDSYEIKSKKRIILEIEDELSSNNYKIERINSAIKDILELKEDLKKTIKRIIKDNYGYFFREFKSDVKKELISFKKEIQGLQENIEDKNKLLHRIKSFEQCRIIGLENYQIVDYKHIKSKHYKACKLVNKENFNSLFPDVIDFNSESDFLRSARSKNHVLIVDFSLIKDRLEANKQELIVKLETNKKNFKKCKKELKLEVRKFLKKNLRTEKKSLKKINNINLGLQDRLCYEKNELERIKETERKENEKNYKEASIKEEEEKYQIMKKYKGLYGFNWKYRRKTWDFSKKPIFLDFGENIFYIKDELTLNKISHKEFINLIKTDDILRFCDKS